MVVEGPWLDCRLYQSFTSSYESSLNISVSLQVSRWAGGGRRYTAGVGGGGLVTIPASGFLVALAKLGNYIDYEL